MENNICDSFSPFNFIVAILWIFSSNSTLLVMYCFTVLYEHREGLLGLKKMKDKCVKPLLRPVFWLSKKKKKDMKALKTQEI